MEIHTFFEDGNEQRSLGSSVSVHVRDQKGNAGPKLLPQKFMAIFVEPTDNEIGAASQRKGNIGTPSEALNEDLDDADMPKIKIGINGYGSIGRIMARIALESDDVELVAINDSSITIDQMTCMFRDIHDHWLRSDFKMKDSNTLMFGEKEVTIFRIKEPDKIFWNETGAEYVVVAYAVESTADCYKNRTSKYKHYIDISSDGNIFGNRLSPLTKILHDRFGLVEDMITTCRAPVLHIKPQTSNAAMAVGEVLPHWKGMDGAMIFRVPAVDATPTDLAIELDAYKEYGLMLSNTKPSIRFCMLLAWCAEMTRQIPDVNYCEMKYGVKA